MGCMMWKTQTKFLNRDPFSQAVLWYTIFQSRDVWQLVEIAVYLWVTGATVHGSRTDPKKFHFLFLILSQASFFPQLSRVLSVLRVPRVWDPLRLLYVIKLHQEKDQKAGFVCFCFPFLCIICPGLPQLSLCLCFLVLGLQACTPSPSSKLFNNQNPFHMPSVLNTHSQNTNKAA